MKKIISALLFSIVIGISAQAQNSQPEGQLIPKTPFKIEVGNLTTTVIVFPWAVKDADRGMSNILASKVTGVENVIQLKATNPFQDTTNLHIYTADGRVHPFWVTFNPLPSTTTYEWSANTSSPVYTPVKFQNTSKNDAEISDLVKKAWAARSFFHRRTKRFRMGLSLRSIYYDDEVMLAKLRLQNNSKLSYQAGWMQLYIADQKRAKRSSVQQLNVNLLYSDPLPCVKGKQFTEWLVAFPKTTIPDNKKLMLEVQEKNGGRNLSFEIRNKDLFKAKSL